MPSPTTHIASNQHSQLEHPFYLWYMTFVGNNSDSASSIISLPGLPRLKIKKLSLVVPDAQNQESPQRKQCHGRTALENHLHSPGVHLLFS